VPSAEIAVGIVAACGPPGGSIGANQGASPADDEAEASAKANGVMTESIDAWVTNSSFRLVPSDDGILAGTRSD